MMSWSITSLLNCVAYVTPSIWFNRVEVRKLLIILNVKPRFTNNLFHNVLLGLYLSETEYYPARQVFTQIFWLKALVPLSETITSAPFRKEKSNRL